MRLGDLSVRKRRDTVTLALEFVLQDLTAPASTAEVVEALCKRLDVGADEKSGLARVVVSLAPLFTREAKRSAATAGRYGKTWHPWIWSPRRSATPAAPAQSAVETFTDAEGVVRARHVEPPEEW